MTIGNDSHCPIVVPKARKPRKSSGSRKTSLMMRALPYPARKTPLISPWRTRTSGFCAKPCEQDEKHQSLKNRFVELARMTRLWPTIWKHDRPRNVSWSAKQLRLDEIGHTTEKKADWGGRCNEVDRAAAVGLPRPVCFSMLVDIASSRAASSDKFS